MPTKDYQTDLLKRLAHGEYAALYLKAAFDETLVDGNKSAFLLALKNVVEATGAMQTVVNEAHISRQHYKKYDNTVLDKTQEISKPKINRVLR